MEEILKAVKTFIKKADIFLLAVCLIATGIGIVLISSAARTLEGGASRYITIQSFATVIGIIVFIFMTYFDVEHFSSLWKWILAFNILFILILIPFGTSGDTGNRSWMRFSFLPFGIQPAEVVKITFIIVLAKQMYSLRSNINHISSIVKLMLHLGLMIGLIYIASNDSGMIIVYICIFIAMALAAGIHFRWFLLGGVLTAAATPFIWSRLDDYQQMRVLVVLNPELDPLGKGYHAIQSKIALGAGKLFGQGLYNGTQTQSSRLPAKHTDFIFSVAGEELGFIGCIVIIMLLCVIIVRCLIVAMHAKSGMSSLVCVGIAGMLIFQTFENIGMCLGLTPIIGLTLPFISYGGSSIVTLYAAMGIISSIHMRPKPHWREYGSKRL